MHSIHLLMLVMLWRSDAVPVDAREVRSRPAATPVSDRVVADTVRGVVFDSITNAPMADAFVVAEPGGAVTATTREGRFILVSPARVRKISVYHDVTEKLGLSGLSIIRPDPSQPWTDVMLATPSMTTLWTTHCPGQEPQPGMGGILMGNTRSSRDSTAVAGAKVSVRWYRPSSSGKKSVQSGMTTVVANHRGEFIVCGIHDVGETRIQATTAGARSMSVVIPASAGSVHRVELILGYRGF